jgi:hypothetical protein
MGDPSRSFAAGTPTSRIVGFDAWLRAKPDRDDTLLVLGEGGGHLHDVIEVANGRIRMLYDPSVIVIDPR